VTFGFAPAALMQPGIAFHLKASFYLFRDLALALLRLRRYRRPGNELE
jgi:hypothetical protein